MDIGYIISGALVAAYVITGLVLFVRARRAGSGKGTLAREVRSFPRKDRHQAKPGPNLNRKKL